MGGIYLSKSDSKHKFVKDILVKKKRRLTSCSLPAEKGEIASKKKLKSTPQKDKRKMITGNHYDSPGHQLVEGWAKISYCTSI